MIGLSTLNRELAKNLARQPGVEVTILLPHYSEREKQEANDCQVSLATPEPMTGFDSIRALSFTREDHDIDVVVGHGPKLGVPAQVIAKQCKCDEFIWYTLPVKSLQCLRKAKQRYMKARRSTELK